MKCGFCGREVDKGVVECPYCHYRFEVDAQVLSPNERDTFEGVTIEEDGTTIDNKNIKDNNNRQYDENIYGNKNYNGQSSQRPNIKVHSLGCGSSILMTLFILGGILALVFFLLPTFIVFAAIGAVLVFILRLFM